MQAQLFDPRQQMQKETYEVFYYHGSRGAEVAVHHHDFYELYCFLGDTVDYWIDGHTYTLTHGDILLIDPLTLHRPLVKAKTEYERYVLWIDRSFLDGLADGYLSRAFHTHTLLSGEHLTALLTRLVEESHSDAPASAFYADAIFGQLMVELARTTDTPAIGKTEALVAQVLSYIGEHYAESLSLDSLSEVFYTSKYHLSHRFKEETGTSLYQYILYKRLAAARQLLIDGVQPAEAAERSGFTDYTTFYRAFRSRYGCSPSHIHQV